MIYEWVSNPKYFAYFARLEVSAADSIMDRNAARFSSHLGTGGAVGHGDGCGGGHFLTEYSMRTMISEPTSPAWNLPSV